ncbi:hypothetical protein PMAYCL1PPCAC_00502, partial [Pristionchus mayeri]
GLLKSRGTSDNSSSVISPALDNEWDQNLIAVEMGLRMLHPRSEADFAKAYLDFCEIFRTGNTEMIEWLSNHVSELHTHFMKLNSKQEKCVFDELVRQIYIKQEPLLLFLRKIDVHTSPDIPAHGQFRTLLQ